jgi:hypothetical protein
MRSHVVMLPQTRSSALKPTPTALFRKDCSSQTPERSVYCLRHTAICMRIILSHGKVNIFNLAKNAGTSVEQIERFYAKHLQLSREMAKNLQSFGE